MEQVLVGSLPGRRGGGRRRVEEPLLAGLGHGVGTEVLRSLQQRPDVVLPPASEDEDNNRRMNTTPQRYSSSTLRDWRTAQGGLGEEQSAQDMDAGRP